MTSWLRGLGIAVLALGVGAGMYAATRAAGDVGFGEIAAQYARHPESWALQAEYYPAVVRHYGLVAGAIAGIVGGLVFGSLLLGVGALLARQTGERTDPPETKKAG
jgi:hypothetical protein